MIAGTQILLCATRLALACLTGICGLAEIIDRIAITVANQVVTQGQIEEEIHVTAFLNSEKAELSAEEKKKAADRLIEQALIKRDMDLSHYPMPAPADANEPLKNIKARYSSGEAYQQALQQSSITEDALTRRLWWQLTVLRFIDYRFRSGIQVPEADVQAFYQQQLGTWREQGVQPLPRFEDTRDSLEQILAERRIDEALERWLADTRKQVAIKYHDEALR